MSVPPLPPAFGNYALGDFVEVVAPDAISWLPQTAGWLGLGLAVLVVGGRYTGRALRHWYRNRYRREAMARLYRLSQNRGGSGFIGELNHLLKLVALVAYPREMVAKLSGEAWASFLNKQCNQAPFSPQQLQLLSVGSYQNVTIATQTRQDLVDASLHWIKTHQGAHNA